MIDNAQRWNKGKPRVDLLPPELDFIAVKGYEYGIKKGYPERNCDKGFTYETTLSSMRRHMDHFRMGEDIDNDFDLEGNPVSENHAYLLLWNAIQLAVTVYRGRTDLDDRVRHTPISEYPGSILDEDSKPTELYLKNSLIFNSNNTIVDEDGKVTKLAADLEESAKAREVDFRKYYPDHYNLTYNDSTQRYNANMINSLLGKKENKNENDDNTPPDSA